MKHRAYEVDLGMESIATRPLPLQPYMRLWAAAFLQGIRDVATERSKRDMGRATRWFYDDDDDDTGSFVWLCSLFNIDPAVARSKILQQWRDHVDRKARIKDEEYLYG